MNRNKALAALFLAIVLSLVSFGIKHSASAADSQNWNNSSCSKAHSHAKHRHHRTGASLGPRVKRDPKPAKMTKVYKNRRTAASKGPRIHRDPKPAQMTTVYKW